MIDILTGTAGSVIDNKDDISKILSARVLCDNVYNLFHGQIVYIGASNGRAVVNVKCNPSEVLRYGNLKELTCAKSYYAEKGAQLGVADGFVIFEYCTLWKGNSVYPVRINNFTYYKQNPSDILNGLYEVRRDGAQEQGYVVNGARITSFTDEQKALFGDNIYDKFAETKASQVKSTSKSRSVIKKLNSKRPLNYIPFNETGGD